MHWCKKHFIFLHLVWIKVSLTPQSLSVKKKEVFHLKCETFVENAAANSVTYHWYKNNVHIDVYQPLAEFSVEEDTRFKCGVQRGTTLYGVSEVASVEISTLDLTISIYLISFKPSK